MERVLNIKKRNIRLICSALFGVIIGFIIAFEFNGYNQKIIEEQLCKDKNCWYIYEYNDTTDNYQLYHCIHIYTNNFYLCIIVLQ